ncbi:MAG: methylmalonyl-CoA mutase, partial [Rhodothermales bacterium]|nr:methylmalonyl-CoA mutase [Rhodothermales bacterium]
PFGPSNPRSMALRTHCQTSGWSLTAQDPFNNVARTTVEALGAVMGHTQSLHTNALDEALALPSEFSARIARNTQLVLQHETGLTKAVDPWAGSYTVERLTHELLERAWQHIGEVEEAGGMSRAIEQGIPKQRIEEAAARRQARIDAGEDVIVGINRFQSGESEEINLLEVDNVAVREEQLERLRTLRANRDESRVQAALESLRNGAAGDGNLLELAVDAARARATLGEISDAAEDVFGRYVADIPTISGVFAAEMGDNENFKEARDRADRFASVHGRRPRILVAKLGQDGHDRGARVVATAFADVGYDVDVGPLFQIPEEAARQAVENDVHVIGVSSLAGGHKTLVPAIVEALAELGRPDILVVVGGVIPPNDYQDLFKDGVAAVFGPGTVLTDAAIELVDLIDSRQTADG